MSSLFSSAWAPLAGLGLATPTWALTAVAAAAALALVPAARRRWHLSRAKHRSLAGHSRMAKRVAGWVPGYRLEGPRVFDADGAPPEVAAQRQAALQAQAERWRVRFARTLAATSQARPGLSDLQFTGAYRVPFPFSDALRQHLPVGAFVEHSDGFTVADLDGNTFIDLTGSYGVNVFGQDFYKACIDEATRRARPLGAVLGAYHPCVADVVARLQRISGLEEVSFHMSGTEAVMQAVRLARYHTGRRHLVRFAGAYHGWWEDVQPGPGNPMPPRETYTLAEMSERSLRVLRERSDIACVLVNPLQALHPNKAAPGDSSLVDGSRRAGYDRAAYTRWLQQLREVCTARGIVLIFDEVFLGFRLDPRGAQAYFGVQADLVTYGKTLGGGLPVGVLCGRRSLMKRYREDRPADLCFARGTFNAHPYVMCAMQVFLERLESPEIRHHYVGLDERFEDRARRLNAALDEAGAPVRARAMSTVWTIEYTQPGRYHWMFQYHLREQGLALSWVGTGRLIFPLTMDERTFDEVVRRFVRAAQTMRAAGWWWHDGQTTHADLRRRVLGEMLTAWWAARRSPRHPAQGTGDGRLSRPGDPALQKTEAAREGPAARPEAGAAVPSSTA
jgi:glutamate-1-semialdehyde 2,1-aminomutase